MMRCRCYGLVIYIFGKLTDSWRLTKMVSSRNSRHQTDSKLESWGDAQSFRPAQKIYYSDARIFIMVMCARRSHIRLRNKIFCASTTMRAYFPNTRSESGVLMPRTEVLAYLGTHPKFMKGTHSQT